MVKVLILITGIQYSCTLTEPLVYENKQVNITCTDVIFTDSMGD